MDIVGVGCLILALVFLTFHWSYLPDKIPGHFNGLGDVDRFGLKYELILLPIISSCSFIFMSLLERAPHLHNYPARLDEANVEQFYLQSKVVKYD